MFTLEIYMFNLVFSKILFPNIRMKDALLVTSSSSSFSLTFCWRHLPPINKTKRGIFLFKLIVNLKKCAQNIIFLIKYFKNMANLLFKFFIGTKLLRTRVYKI